MGRAGILILHVWFSSFSCVQLHCYFLLHSMRSVECPDAVAASQAEQVSAREGLADFARRHLVSGQALAAGSGQVLVFAPLVRLRARADSQHLLRRTVHSHRGHFFPAGAISSGSTARLDFAASIIVLLFLTAASDVSRLFSLAADCSWERHSFLLTTGTTTLITMELHRRSRLQ